MRKNKDRKVNIDKTAKRKRLWILLGFVVVAVALYLKGGYISGYDIETTEYDIEFEILPEAFEGFKIVQISDVHNALFNTENFDLIRTVYKLKPDMIVLTGDMINYGTTRFTRLFPLVEQLEEICEVYYILGNHEQTMRVANMLLITEEMEKLGVKMLFNDTVRIERDNEAILLHGLCQYKKSYRDPYYSEESTYEFSLSDMEKMLGKSSDELVDVVLAHNPMYFDVYAEWGADLIFSGHIHGGHWRIPIIDKGIFSPNEELFPEYDGGEYIKNKAHMIVSRGLNNGMEFIPRLFNRPELVVVNLIGSPNS